MSSTTYDIFLNNMLIGTTMLEHADPAMGYVFGNIKFCIDGINYNFIKEYCVDNGINLSTDYPEEKIISTYNIPQLKVVSNKGVEIKGDPMYINGMDNDKYEINIGSIPYILYEQQFPHHVQEYETLHLTQDSIVAIGIDEQQQLYIKPRRKRFPYIYREAKGINWDDEKRHLYAQTPREWSYTKWYKHIITVIAKDGYCQLLLDEKTLWINIPDDLKNEIQNL